MDRRGGDFLMRSKKSLGDYITDWLIIIFMGVYAIIAVIPFIYVLVASFTPPAILAKERFILIPKGFTLDAYKYIFSTSTVLQALKISVFVTVVGTLYNIFMTVIFAYPLAHTNIKGRRVILFLVTFTMLFSGGLVPGYMVLRSLGFMNKLSVLIIPGAISTFNFIIFRNYFQGLPKELEESAMLDGAGYLRILAVIILPVSMPLIATFVVMYGVGNWNSWFRATLYISDSTKWPIMVILRLIMNVASGIGDSGSNEVRMTMPPESVRMAVIVVATAPILMVYPFLQKHFAKGSLIGSIKG
jgi:putative aldouronate transport system permease protein